MIKKGIERIIISDATSTSGKYYIFLGQHLVGGFPCYDVCATVRTSTTGGALIAKHFPSAKDPKAREHALILWDQFRDAMIKPRSDGEDQEPQDPMEMLN